MEGRTIARPNRTLSASTSESGIELQWRAGQLPGQTTAWGEESFLPWLTSMEGRTIARPNTGSTSPTGSPPAGLQWRAGQLPGQTQRMRGMSRRRAALQWRAGQLPGQTAMSARISTTSPLLQWRAGQLPGQTPRPSGSPPGDDVLQWRAGQLPGQTGDGRTGCDPGLDTSMEGRTIARPNTTPRTGLTTGTGYFNGGPDNCPAKPPPPRCATPGPTHFNGGPDNCPAKPTARRCRGRRAAPHFNGGPDNCPAKRLVAGTEYTVTVLQWRAGQLPGQTRGAVARILRPGCTSMEGRTIARPNGGPTSAAASDCELQWRAGQLPGQTSASARHRWRRRNFNGGPDNCPAKHPVASSSMAAVADFNGGPDNCPAKRRLAGRCRRRRRHFNGGPDNCPAKRGDEVPRRPGPPQTSMEGRTIARPNASRSPRPTIAPTGYFNGGPDNCPAKRSVSRSTSGMSANFNGGPDNCPAKPPTT